MRNVAPHQEKALALLEKWWGSKSTARAHGFVAMPTGSGKTFTAVRFAVNEVLAKRRGPCVVWVAHNEFLLGQAKDEFATQLAEAGLADEIEIGHAKGDGAGSDANLIFATIQTLARGAALTKIKRAGDVHLVIFDEFHHLAADQWREVPRSFKRSKKTRTLGLSATPFRKTPEKTELLREILPHRIYSVGYSELIRGRFLAEPSLIRFKVENPTPVTLNAKEWTHLRQFRQLSASALAKIAAQGGRDDLIFRTYKQDADRFQSTIVFCCSIDHAEALAQMFTDRGVQAKAIYGSAHDAENRQKLQEFKDRKFKVVTGVNLLTEGVDVPSCRTVFLARPTESPILLSQMMGRAMRGPKVGGGATCNVVDFVDNLGDGLDLAASHFAFVRDKDERIRHLVRRRSAPEAQGVSMALLLRIREYLNELFLEHGNDFSLGDVLREDVTGWFEYWDGEVERILLVPQREQGGQIIQDALDDVDDQAAQMTNHDDKLLVAADVARRVYDEHLLDVVGIPEEDFVGMATARATDAASVKFHALVGPAAIQDDQQKRDGASAAAAQLELDLASTGVQPEFRDALDALRAALRG